MGLYLELPRYYTSWMAYFVELAPRQNLSDRLSYGWFFRNAKGQFGH
jgi:hypothetical protein